MDFDPYIFCRLFGVCTHVRYSLFNSPGGILVSSIFPEDFRPVCPGSVPWSPPEGTCLESHTGIHLRGILARLLLIWRDGSSTPELLPGDWVFHPALKEECRHPAVGSHSGDLFPWPNSFGHYPQLVNTGSGNIDRLVNLEFSLSVFTFTTNVKLSLQQ